MLPPERYKALLNQRVSRVDNWYFIIKSAYHSLAKDTSSDEQLPSRRLVQPGVPQIIIASLEGLQNKHLITVMTFCLLPDRLHVLFHLENKANLEKVLKEFESVSGSRVNREIGPGKLWAKGYYNHPFKDSSGSDISIIIEYIENLPVQAGLEVDAEDWPWSSSHWHPKNNNIPAMNLTLPVKPVKDDGKSIFFTCHKCGKEKPFEALQFVNGQSVCMACKGRQRNDNHRYHYKKG